MVLLLVSFIAGVLTILAPCVLPVLPIVVGGSLSGERKRNPIIITATLAVSIVLFTLLLKASTVFINIPQSVWSYISGAIIIFLGLLELFPALWSTISARFGFGNRSDQLLAKSSEKKTWVGDVFIGASLGPVFSACSPVYFFLLASVLPVSFGSGVIYIVAYALGLSSVLLAIAYIGQRLVQRLRFAADPKGWFKRGIGILFILVGIFIMTGLDKRVQACLLESGYVDVNKIEIKLLDLIGK
ncbi:MAG: cytochrome c biogenesis protein CcdA [Patescibacteria group bacterium]